MCGFFILKNMKKTIIETKGLTSIYPGTNNAYECVVIFCGTEITINIPEAEYKLIIYLQSIQSKLNQKELKKLFDLIESYGEEKYYNGGLDATYQG